jgi:hypothetical protein
MTEVSSNGAIADHRDILKLRKPLLIRRRIGYFCYDRTVEEVMLYSTNADGVSTPPFKCCGSTGDVLSLGDIQQRRRHRQRQEKQTVKHG